MAKHDIFLVDGIIEERITQGLPSTDKGEVFEYLSAEQILKDYDLSYEQIIDNSVDGCDDGGIDYIFFFVNGQLVSDVSAFSYPKTSSELDVYFITCKHADSFKLAPIDSIYASLSELVDFSIAKNELRGRYNHDVLQKREDFLNIYKHTAIAPDNKIKIHVVYACRGSTEELGESVVARSKQVEHVVSKNFSNCCSEFAFWGSTEILLKYRKSKTYDIDLPFQKMMGKGSHSVVLTKLKDYYNFVKDEDGQLRRYLFDANVRDYMGLNRVNQDILETLQNPDSTDFWLLNNGVTILVSSIVPLGEMATLRNIQIVNGLQTTLTIYDFFSAGGTDPNNRCILIKIIKSDDPVVRDGIIKATNNQTDVSVSSLRATDKIQRDIEEVMLQYGFYYERKKKYYENQGVSPEEIITPLYLASAFVTLVLKLPHQATTLKQKFMNDQEKYELVFSEKNDIHIWPQLAKIFKKTDAFIRKKRKHTNASGKLNKYLRQNLAFFTVAQKFKKFTFTITDIIKLDVDSIIDADFESIWQFIDQKLKSGSSPKNLATRQAVLDLCGLTPDIKHAKNVEHAKNPFLVCKRYDIEEDFLVSVAELLPPQPWPLGVHRSVAEKLGCPPSKVYQAIDELIANGQVYNQINGKLYDKDGKCMN